ncbi:hypothetical protein UFOVP240_18 [uncultured Caudovirales phage]|uniref:Uncharacterized protein n=1 Tax=uncultured Caudovirales phage TaxID=2100421 RepID=A0A6J7WVF3_9CAUD|nr:hypothetical protein UFOVP240_18 [uncultured Caudovirales phage]
MKHLQIPLTDSEEAVHSLLLENMRLKSQIEMVIKELNMIKKELDDAEIYTDC